MKSMFKPASLLAAALTLGIATGPVSGGEATAATAQAQLPHPAIAHGMMQPDAAQQQPPKLGLAMAAIAPDDLDNLALEYGVRVVEVITDSVAERIGVKPGDVVTDVAGRPAYSPERLQRIVGEASGKTTIALVRDGEALKLQADFTAPAQPADSARGYLGVRIQEMTDDLKEAFGAAGNSGVLVAQVMDGSAAAQAGLKAGDVLVSIAGDKIESVAHVHAALDGHAAGNTVQVSILRDRAPTTVSVVLDSGPQLVRPQAAHPHGRYGRHGHDPHHPPGMMAHPGCHMGKGQRSS